MTKKIIPSDSIPFKICSANNCDEQAIKRGYCDKHHARFVRYGSSELLSEKGEFRKLSKIEKFWKRVDKKPTGCWEWNGYLNSAGYGIFYSDKQRMRAHRYSWFLAFGNLPEMFLLHSCDNPKCVNPEHLREGTQQENMKDKVSRNRQLKGGLNPRAKLSGDDIILIKELIDKGFLQKKIAEMFKVSSTVISNIKTGKCWN